MEDVRFARWMFDKNVGSSDGFEPKHLEPAQLGAGPLRQARSGDPF
jgi:hypothetical protein